MATQENILKLSKFITNQEEIRSFLNENERRYDLSVNEEILPGEKLPDIIVIEESERMLKPDLIKELEKYDNGHYRLEIGISARQRNALTAIYNEANGKKWYRQDNWCNKEVNLEDWYGVKTKTKVLLLRGTKQRALKIQVVTGLDLSHNNIYCGRYEDNGRISPKIGDLTDLEFLNLGYNFIHGRIPDNIWKLTNLKELYLHFNQLDGKISPKIGNLTKLRRMQLDHNHLTGAIPETIGNLKDLEWLCLHVNNLDSDWKREIHRLIELKKPISKLPARYQTPLPVSLGSLNKLEKFMIYNNQLFGKIPTSVRNNPNFKYWEINPQQDDMELTW